MATVQADQSSGVYINAGYTHRSIPENCLTWVKPIDKGKWNKRGVVIWNNEAKKVEDLSAKRALAFLNHLKTTETWKSTGVPITVQYTCLTLEEKPTKRRSRKGQTQLEDESPKDRSNAEEVVEERFWIAPQTQHRQPWPLIPNEFISQNQRLKAHVF